MSSDGSVPMANPPASDNDALERLQSLLDVVPPPLEPLDVSALDGFICGVLLQPEPVPSEEWLPRITDVEGRALPAGFDAQALHALVLDRAAELRAALQARRWFDPWIFELEVAAAPGEALLPWVAGFVTALELYPGLLQFDDPRLLEPLALLYMHFDAADLDDADALLALIETLEPPRDLAEAVQDVVRSLMLIADVVHPREAAAGVPRRRKRAGAPQR